MNIKHSIGLNLSADAIPGRLHMVQGDSNSRTIVATLWDGAQLYSIPTEAAVMVRFRKPDGTGGLYDTSESGQKVSYTGSIVTAPVATQMLAVAGDVFAEIDIFGGGAGAAAERLATFRFVVEVAPCVLPDAEIISSDYYNILASKVAEAVAAADRAEQAQSAAAVSAEAAATSAANAATSVEGAVKYNVAQTLTDAQKQQARDNIDAPAPYTAGENISISGSVIATKAFPCNPNLLDNWYFGNPVDQRGGYIQLGGTMMYKDAACTEQFGGSSTTTPVKVYATYARPIDNGVELELYIPLSSIVRGYYVGTGYMIDRWTNQTPWGSISLTCELQSDGCKLTGANVSMYPNSYARLVQIIDPDICNAIDGKLCTLSLLCSGATAGSTGVLPILAYSDSENSGPYQYEINSDFISVTFKFQKSYDRIGVLFTQDCSLKITAAKLELGSQQTFAHQENGVWVLNEIPDFGEQLRKCQRYFYRLNSHAYGWSYNNSIVNCLIPLPVTLRTMPVLTIHSSGTINTVTGDASMTSYELKGLPSNGLIIDLHNTENAFTPGTPVVWHNFDIALSADL